jgi:hypothetical protein
MSTTLTSLAPGRAHRSENQPSGALRLMLLTAALSAGAGALATAALDRLTDASAPLHLAAVASKGSPNVVGRDPGVPDAGTVFSGRETPPEEPVATF